MLNHSDVQALPIPRWFEDLVERTRNGELFMVPYADIAAELPSYLARLEVLGIDLQDPVMDDPQIGFLIIDGQITFCYRGGELTVGGAEEDSINTAMVILQYAHIISRLAFTLDTHKTFQIFHPFFWVNEAGEHPAAFTAISYADVRNGVWVPNPALCNILNVTPVELVSWALHYTKTLEENSQLILVIWPIHGKLGGIGHALMPVIEAAAYWWEILRGAQCHYEIKGGNPLTEMYGVVEGEVSIAPDGSIIAQPQVGLIRLLAECDIVWFAGQALTHCVPTTCKQLWGKFGDPQYNAQHLLGRLRIFWFLSSPVGGFEHLLPDIRADLESMDFAIIEGNTPFDQWL